MHFVGTVLLVTLEGSRHRGEGKLRQSLAGCFKMTFISRDGENYP